MIVVYICIIATPYSSGNKKYQITHFSYLSYLTIKYIGLVFDF